MDKPGRNAPCPCGSGKKYKQCCLARETSARPGTALTAASQLVEADAHPDATGRLVGSGRVRRPCVALAMIARDGAEKIGRCLESVRGVVDEIVVVDTGSTDATRAVAASYGARVYDYAWADDFAAARNDALARAWTAGADWALVLDHDEWLVGDAAGALRAAVAGGPALGQIRIVNKFEQDGQIRFANAFVPRLLPRGTRYQGRIHEQPVVNGPTWDTAIEAHHDGYFQTDKSKRNMRLLNRALEERGADPYLLFHLGRQHRNARRYDLAAPYYEQGYALLTRREPFAANLIVDYIYNCMALRAYDTALAVALAEEEYLQDFPDFHLVRGLLYMEYTAAAPDDVRLYKIKDAFMTSLALGETKRYYSVQGAGGFLAAYNLGSFYDQLGDKRLALVFYERAAADGFQLAVERLAVLTGAAAMSGSPSTARTALAGSGA